MGGHEPCQHTQPKGRERWRERRSPAHRGGQRRASPPGHGVGAPQELPLPWCCCRGPGRCTTRVRDGAWAAAPCPPAPHLGYVEGLRVLLVEGEDARDELGELLLQLLAGHQVAHGSHGLHHRQSQLWGDTKC